MSALRVMLFEEAMMRCSPSECHLSGLGRAPVLQGCAVGLEDQLTVYQKGQRDAELRAAGLT
jgi:hypothetical protein